MELYLKACGGILLCVILVLTLGNRGKEMGALLGIGVCCMGAMIALAYLEPVVDFIRQLQSVGNIDTNVIGILLKAVGIGIVSEIAALICVDSGNSSLGKTLQIVGTAVILWLSLPLFSMLMELLQNILGEL